ncbi:MAG: autotransporter-associated beta strand repeat-containing protein, partial [Planctomycetales bacterium]|nr:autotransporter-associated beta strand repeat-containing protein [Planctomycetales bacterium]
MAAKRRSARMMVVLLSCLLSTRSLNAQSSTWVGVGGGDWFDASKWIGPIPSQPGDAATFIRTLPRSAANVQLAESLALGQLSVQTIAPLSLIGEAITFDNIDESASLTVQAGAGKLTVSNPMQVPGQLAVQVAADAAGLELRGPLSGAGTIRFTGGDISLAADSPEWRGTIDFQAGQARIATGGALGVGIQSTRVVSGGTLTLDAPINVPIEIREGARVVANQNVANAVLAGGSLVVNVDTSGSLLDASSSGGTVELNANLTADILLPASSSGTSLLVAVKQNVPAPNYAERMVTGRVAMAPSTSPNHLRLGSSGFAGMVVQTPLLKSRGIENVDIVSGEVRIDASTDYVGQTIVASGAKLVVQHPFGLGTNRGTEADATIVESGGWLSVGSSVAPAEMIILAGGRFTGAGRHDITIRGSGIIDGNFNNPGRISGEGELAILDGELAGPVDFRGQILVTGRSSEQSPGIVQVNTPTGFGGGAQPVVVLGGHLRMHAQPTNPIHLESGVVELDLPHYEGELRVRGGSLATTPVSNVYRPVNVDSVLMIDGTDVQLRGHASAPLVLNGSVTSTHDLELQHDVTVNGQLTVQGNLRVTQGAVDFYSQPDLTGSLIVSKVIGVGGAAIVHQDMRLPIVIRNGSLETAGGAVVSSASPTLKFFGGYLNAALGDTDVVEKSREGELTIAGMGGTSAELIVREGIVSVEQASALGDQRGGITIASPKNALVQLKSSSADNPPYQDSIRLGNSSGYNRQGSLLLAAGGPTELQGDIDLGDVGSIVRVESRTWPFTMSGTISGGDFSLVGEGTLQLTAPALYEGATVIGETVLGSPRLLMSGDARLERTSRIELAQRGSLLLDKDSTVASDMLPDNAPLYLAGGELGLRVGSILAAAHEHLGPLELQSGASALTIESPLAAQAGTLEFAELRREPGASVIFNDQQQAGRLGGSGPLDGRILFNNLSASTSPTEIMGSWALIATGGEIDFATYGEQGVRRLDVSLQSPTLKQADAATHVRLAAGETVTADAVVGTLAIDAPNFTGVPIELNGHQLTIAEGGLLSSRGGLSISGGQLKTGDVNGELFVHLYGGDAVIDATIVDGTTTGGAIQPLQLIKSGPGRLALGQANTFTGVTTISQGTVATANPLALAASSHVDVDGGNLINDGPTPLQVKRLSVTAGVATGVNSPQIELRNDGALTNVTGDGAIVKTGAGSA